MWNTVGGIACLVGVGAVEFMPWPWELQVIVVIALAATAGSLIHKAGKNGRTNKS